MNLAGYSPHGTDLFGDTQQHSQHAGRPLMERFVFPPFTVLDARSGPWQERKKAWLSLGIQSEIGRHHELMYTNQAQLWGYLGHYSSIGGSSVFDPVLCELMYNWFCPPGGQIVDPFAGGSVRGVVAAKLGYKYWGSELRPEQVEANRAQAVVMCADCEHQPVWVCGDSMDMLLDAPPANFIFSCPPYGNLEVYSGSPLDLSNMSEDNFVLCYQQIIKHALDKLLPGHLACFVVGDYRDKKTGLLTQFVHRTVEAFNRCGYQLYNDGILVTSVGSLPIRVSAQFDDSRKLGRTHQNVLVFAKGE